MKLSRTCVTRRAPILAVILLVATGCGEASGGSAVVVTGLAADGAAVLTPAPAASQSIDPEKVAAAGSAASMGFNNAAQVVTASDGSQHFVFVDDGRTVVHGSATGTAAALEVTEVRSGGGRVSLTAIAASDDVLVIGWIESDASKVTVVYVSTSLDSGRSWSAPTLLESNASGLSLAGVGKLVVAAWFVEDETGAEIHFSSRDASTGQWSAPVRIDGSNAAPLWAAVAVAGDGVWVTWRDDRSGAYHVYLRRSLDGGLTWEAELEITASQTGDPTVCAATDGVVWLAHHGRGKITLLHSTDGGTTFGAPVVVGDGWFPRLSCESDGDMILGWEQSVGMSAKNAESKQAVYLTASASGEVSTVVALSDSAGTCASVTVRGDGYADVVWIEGTEPLKGDLWHAVVRVG